jgi:hypothetical protein
METTVSTELAELESRWRLRQQAWGKKLVRLHLGVEPLEEQLSRYRRVTWALTIVPTVIALMFLSLFTVFGRPDIGILVISLMLLPIVLFSWLDYWRLERRARAYTKELAEFEAKRNRLLQGDISDSSP